MTESLHPMSPCPMSGRTPSLHPMSPCPVSARTPSLHPVSPCPVSARATSLREVSRRGVSLLEVSRRAMETVRRWRLPHLAGLAGLAAACLALPPQTNAQEAPGPALAPVPYPVTPPPGYRQAVEAGTRTDEGAPGDAYWQQWTEYRIDARLLPEENRLEGRETIRYHNRSPHRLDSLFLHLHQNLHAGGTIRKEPAGVTGGVTLSGLSVNGVPLEPFAAAEEARGDGGADGGSGASGDGPGYGVDATILRVRPPHSVDPGETVELSLEWSFPVPKDGAGRMGRDSGNLFYIGYWYPRMAVYDDVVGWQTDPYLGRGEFYDGFGSYDVTLEVPEGWVVRATGTLRNPGDVFPREILDRLERADASDSVVHVLGAGEFGPGRSTLDVDGDTLRWHFRADTVRDFAFSATRQSRWDAARTPVGDRDGDGTTDHARVEALWREDATPWRNTWRYARHSLDFLSRYTGMPYPWPHMTAVEGDGIIDGGMEFPMMTLMGDYVTRGDSALYYVTAHEFAHMWVPMTVGTDEKRYAWMDEGMTTFNENRSREEFFPGSDPDAASLREYLATVESGDELSMMRWADYYHSDAYTVASYHKPALVLATLRSVLGEETFREGLRTFLSEWRYRHPYPWDLFRTFERVSGRELGWFWRSWYYETVTLDQAIVDVRRDDEVVTVVVENQGLLPMPVRVAVTPEDGYTSRAEVGVEPWLRGERRVELRVPAPEGHLVVEVDPGGHFPDVDRSDNVWEGEL